MRKALIAGVAFLAFGTGVAGAADMHLKAPPAPPPPFVAAIGMGEVFSKGRDFGAWLGLLPKQAFAVSSPKRNPALPNVPTSKEAGLPEFQVSAWFALFAPKDTRGPGSAA